MPKHERRQSDYEKHACGHTQPPVVADTVLSGSVCKSITESRRCSGNRRYVRGGMGMTDELAICHYFKRATMIEGLFGSVDHHLRRYETLSFGKAA